MPYLIALAAAVILYFWNRRRRFLRRRRQLLQTPLDNRQIDMLRTCVPLYDRLPEHLQRQLQGLIQAFLAEKQFEGCGGLELTDEIRMAIAGQACLLLLNRPVRLYPRLKTILVYPHTYIGTDGAGGGSARLGESWQNGPVVLAWDSVQNGAAILNDGKNVVMHEFAHQLDQEDGTADGAPILSDRSRYRPWAQILGREYQALRRKARFGQRTTLDRYGAENPAEFFAVATETFFEKPRQLSRKHPELYQELKSYYRLDPLTWQA